MIQVRTYKGHICNFKALMAELSLDPALAAHREAREEAILLKAYETWGSDMGHHLHGKFAFALYDDAEDKLFCMRDQFGTVPFYYYETAEGNFLVGTSIREIMAQPGFVKELNDKLLQIYLSLTYTTGPETFFKGLMKLMPGRFLVRQGGRNEITRYFRPEFHPDESKTLEQWADEIESTLKIILAETKEPEEYAESFLSSGVDSSYIFAQSGLRVSNSCGYDDSRLDESGLAAETAQALGRENRRLVVSPEDYFGIVSYVQYHMEQPLGDASALVFALGCIAAAKHCKVCYSGEGADEFFGGYNMYRNAPRYGENLPTFYVGNTNIMKEEEKKQILKKYYEGFVPLDLARDIYKENAHLDPLSKMLDVDIQMWLEGDIYLNIDKMSTAAGLDVRMPLTDTRIFDIASRIPPHFKVNDEQNKVALRTAAARVLPEEVAWRKKLGFVVPIRVWMADDRYNADVRAKFRSEMAAKFFDLDAIDAIWQAYVGGDSDKWRQVWTIYVFLVWYEEYFVKR